MMKAYVAVQTEINQKRMLEMEQSQQQLLEAQAANVADNTAAATANAAVA